MTSFVMEVVALAVDYNLVQEQVVPDILREVLGQDRAIHIHPLIHHWSPVAGRNLVSLMNLQSNVIKKMFPLPKKMSLPGDGIEAAFAAAFFFEPASIDCAMGPGSTPPRSNWHSNGKILFV